MANVNMFDIENTMYTELAHILRPKYEGIFMTGDNINVPEKFPAVSFFLQDTPTYTRSLDARMQDHHVRFVYDINGYSNLVTGRVQQCKSIMNDIDQYMTSLAFVRNTRNPIFDSESYYQMFARYTGVLKLEPIEISDGNVEIQFSRF